MNEVGICPGMECYSLEPMLTSVFLLPDLKNNREYLLNLSSLSLLQEGTYCWCDREH